MIVWDALISLLIMSLIMQSLLIAMTMYRRTIVIETTDHTADFQLLLVLLEQEITQYELKSIEPDRILLSDGKAVFEVVVQNNKIFKKPGHHPYAYEIDSWYLQQMNSAIAIEVSYVNQQTFWGLVHVEK